MKHLRGHYLLATFAVSVTLFVGGIYIYMSSHISSSIAKSAASRESVRAANSNKSREQAFLEKYQTTENDWARLPSFFVPSDNVVAFIESLESLGSNAGSKVTLSSIDADNLEAPKSAQTGLIRAHVAAEGSWNSVMRTLELAESMPYKVVVSNVVLNFDSVGTDKDIRNFWSLTFDIQATMLAKK